MGPLSSLESPRGLTELFSRDTLVCRGCRNEILQTGRLNNDLYLLVVLAGRRARSRSQQVWFLLRAVLGLQVATFSLCPHMVCPLFTCILGVSPSFYKATSQTGLRPTQTASFSFHYLFKGPHSKYSHILRY